MDIENIFRIGFGILILISIIAWIKTFFEIVYLEKIKIIKLILIGLIITIPILPILYQVKEIIVKGIINYFKILGAGSKELSKESFSLIKWLSTK